MYYDPWKAALRDQQLTNNQAYRIQASVAYGSLYKVSMRFIVQARRTAAYRN
jgi:hypothetical protein